jgi:hypothetical protein
MTASSIIKKYIDELPEGQAFSASALRTFSTTDNIRQFLNRQVKAGKIKRVTRGVFVKPKHSELVGEILPSAFEIAVLLSKSTGETITVQGAEAARMLQLTTQVPMQLIFYTSGNTRVLKFNNREVKLKHVNPSRLIASGTIPGLIISALNFVGRENVTLNTLQKIKTVTPLKEFTAIFKLIDKMPAWMADAFYRYQKENSNV